MKKFLKSKLKAKIHSFLSRNYVTKDQLRVTLNSLLDVRDCPKAKGKLRKLQIADTLLLRIFHNICVKNGIQYFLEGGTLLGAVRHNGFIPWDDDIDVTIFYDDFDFIVDTLKKELDGTDLQLFGVDSTIFHNSNDRLVINIKNFYYVSIDIFYVYSSFCTYNDKDKVKIYWNRCHKKYYKLFKKIKSIENYDVLKQFRLSVNGEFINKFGQNANLENAKSFIHKISSDFWMMEREDVFPLKLAKFEGIDLFIPNNPLVMLEDQYGSGWDGFPASLGNHSDLFTSFNEADIDAIIDKLQLYLDTKFKL